MVWFIKINFNDTNTTTIIQNGTSLTDVIMVKNTTTRSYSLLIGRSPPMCGESDVIRGCPVGEECCPVGLMTNVCDPKLG